MVLIESDERDTEIIVQEESIPSCSSSSQLETTAATKSKLVGGDDSDGFETASEREVSDNEEDETDRKQDAITNQESQQSDKPNDDESKQMQMKLNWKETNCLEMVYTKRHCQNMRLLYNFLRSFQNLRSICYSNRAICYLKLGKYEEVIKECTKAIELNPSYTKAFICRAEAHEILEHFEEALTDLKKIIELDPSNDQARKRIRRLEPLAAEKREKMKEEAIAKLKEMGNSIFGRFGMSVDNFKAVKDPNTGSYSFSFQN